MRLIDTFLDILYFTVVNKNYGFEQFTCSVLRKRYDDMILASEKSAQTGNIPDNVWRKAFFAVAVWIDESVLLSDWADKAQWCKETLQRTYFKTSNGGVEFFTTLEQLDPNENRIREIYDVCLSLGFKGTHYGESGMGTLKKIINRTIQMIQSDRNPLPPHNLFPCAYKGNSKLNVTVERESRLLFLALSAIVPFLVFILLYVSFQVTLNSARNILISFLQGLPAS
ncbi:MAG: type IVB secretion system protein IcmH/DotU [Chitinispirillaceae bacterium]|nr:type IVB secretion system protein IcmH/DotU [Chitinispirillaceae bacterium]